MTPKESENSDDSDAGSIDRHPANESRQELSMCPEFHAACCISLVRERSPPVDPVSYAQIVKKVAVLAVTL